jgi:hypothetical protein
MPRALLIPAIAVLLAGCDSGPGLLASGADAEVAGNFAEARAHYQEVCDKGSKHCPLANRLRERATVKEAYKHIKAGELGKAKAALDLAKTAADPGVLAAADAALKSEEMVRFVEWSEAWQLADKDQALAKIEPLAGLGVPAAARAREWLEKNRPAILLERIKTNCKAGAKASCAEAGKELAALHPKAAENAEGQRLVKADYERLFPHLKEAENLLIQRIELHDKDALVARCTEKGGPDKGATCEATVVGARKLPTESFLDGAWKKKMEEIGDPHFVKPFEARYKAAGSAGEYDPELWLPPAK